MPERTETPKIFADQVTADVYERRATKQAVHAVSGLLWYVVARRMDIVLSAAHIDDLRRFPRFDLQRTGRRSHTYTIALFGSRRLEFRWHCGDGAGRLKIVMPGRSTARLTP